MNCTNCKKIIDENMNTEEEKELLKYFKVIKKCKLCGAMYGSDQKREINENICPTCELKLIKEKKRKK